MHTRMERYAPGSIAEREAVARRQEFERARQLELTKQQNAAARAKRGGPGSDASKGITETVMEASQAVTNQMIVRPAFMAGFKTFGLTWSILFFYTLVKDMLNAKFLGDPGDVIFSMKGTKQAMQVPAPVKTWSRLGARLFIYPVGGLVAIIILVGLTIMALPYIAVIGGIAWLASTLGF